jgi:hypothetical protein
MKITIYGWSTSPQEIILGICPGESGI